MLFSFIFFMTKDTTPTEDVQALREAFRAKIFRMMLYVAALFGFPAVIAFWVGRMLNDRIAGDFNFQALSLVIAFVFSWIMVFRMYFKLTAESKAIEDKAKQQKLDIESH